MCVTKQNILTNLPLSFHVKQLTHPAWPCKSALYREYTNNFTIL